MAGIDFVEADKPSPTTRVFLCDFHAQRPDLLHIADFTYARPMAGSSVPRSRSTCSPGSSSAGSARRLSTPGCWSERYETQSNTGENKVRLSGTIHHSDAGSQDGFNRYTSLKLGETLMLEGPQPSIGSVGDAYDNALAETTIGLYKIVCIRADSPFRTGPLDTIADVEHITAAWSHWYNAARLMHRYGRRLPAEVEPEYRARTTVGRPADHT